MTLNRTPWTAPEGSLTLLERFMEHVEIHPMCWEWIGAVDEKGYGSIRLWAGPVMRWRQGRATHAAWFLAHGHWPVKRKGEMVCHACDNPSCVRPSHLFLGDATANRHDAIKKGRQRGLTPEQVRWVRSSGLPHREMAELIGVASSTIWKCVNRKTHASIP